MRYVLRYKRSKLEFMLDPQKSARGVPLVILHHLNIPFNPSTLTTPSTTQQRALHCEEIAISQALSCLFHTSLRLGLVASRT